MQVFHKKSLLPGKITRFFDSFFRILKGFFVISAGILGIVSLFFYTSFDNSLNTSSLLPISNVLGQPGAIAADLMMQIIGFSGYYVCVIISIAGFFYIKDHEFHLQKKGVVSFVFATFLLSVLLYLQFSAHGGILTNPFADFILKTLNHYNLLPFLPFISAGIFGAFGYLTLVVFGTTPDDFFRYCRNVYNVFLNVLNYLGRGIYQGFDYIKRRYKGVKIQDLDSTDNNDTSDLIQLQESQPITPKHMDKPKDVKKKSETKTSTYEIPDDILFSQNFHLPPVDLLDEVKVTAQSKETSKDVLQEYGDMLQNVLSEYGIKGEIGNIRPGPVVTMFEFKPAPGIKTARVISLADDIARSMSALSARIATVPGQNVIGIEMPNTQRNTVFIRDLLQSQRYARTPHALPIILGKDIGGEPTIADLAKMPHLLIAGTTGSGKSVGVNAMILSLLFKLSPDRCKFIMIDPKMLELSVYDDIPHLLTPVVTDPKKAVVALKWAVKEMETRYRAMSKLGVRNIDGYNARIQEANETGEVLSRRVQTGFDPETGRPIFETQNLSSELLPYIVIVVDEMADLMMVAGKEIEAAVQRLAQMARAAGIHLIMATQRPSVDVITGTIKANFPTRISFMVTSKIDSRTILGEQGAEQLLGQGDMLFMAGGGRISRVHGPFIKDSEVERIVKFLKTQGEPSYIDSITEEDDAMDPNGGDGGEGGDPTYRQAMQLILREGKVSTSFIQRHLSIGYNRAAKIIDQMEKEGVISPANHVGKREILQNM